MSLIKNVLAKSFLDFWGIFKNLKVLGICSVFIGIGILENLLLPKDNKFIFLITLIIMLPLLYLSVIKMQIFAEEINKYNNTHLEISKKHFLKSLLNY